MAETKSKSQIKKSTWGFVIYPESAPENWRDLLIQSGIACAVSPLHNMDIDSEETGELKKPHYHILLSYDGPTTYNNVLNFTRNFNAPPPIAIESARGTYRYHIHLDNPEKYQYNDRDRLVLNGFNVGKFVELTSTEISNYKRLLIQLIRDNDIKEYFTLIDFTCGEADSNLFDVASSNTLFFNTYLKSRRFGV